MVRKCPQDNICLENFSFFLLILIIFFLIYIFYFSQNKFNSPIIIKENSTSQYSSYPLTQFGISTQNDVLLNPYLPPLKNDNIFSNVVWNNPSIPSIPINISTQNIDSNYRQVGILTRITGSEQILPLMGRPLLTNRDKWNFYTMTDKNNMIKLPISHKSKSCTSEFGCENIYNGDLVYVQGYNDAFKATIYDNDTMRYIPFL